MTQSLLTFKIQVPSSDYADIVMRYSKSREIINKIRSVLGKAIKDLDSPEKFIHAVGRNYNDGSVVPENDASLISKWFISWDDEYAKPEPEILTGRLSLLLEQSSIDVGILNMLILQASMLAGIEIEQESSTEGELDFEVDGANHVYKISNLHHSGHRHWSKEDAVKYLPIGMMPDDRSAHSKSIGILIKRHLVETAKAHGFDSSVIESAAFFVRSKWIACPSNSYDQPIKDYYHSSIEVFFSVPIKLSGLWFAGGHRHVNSGLITSASKREFELLKTGGTFVL